MMNMSNTSGLARARARSISLVLLMLLSVAASANLASASMSRQYTVSRDVTDLAVGDFDCDGDNDIVAAIDNSLVITVLWNNDGDFNERTDIVTASVPDYDQADFEDFSNTQHVEVGEFTGDSAPDIVVYERNRPFRQNAQGALVVNKAGNVTVFENDGCSEDSFSVKVRKEHVWVWDLAVDDVNGDGDDDIVVLELLANAKTQQISTYLGPIGSTSTARVTGLGDSTANSYQEMRLGDWGETQNQGIGTCTDSDIWLVRGPGVDYITGQVTNPGDADNVTIIEFDCAVSSTYPATYAYNPTTPQANTHIINMGVPFGGFDIGDMDEDGTIDVVAMNEGNTENVTFVTSNSLGAWSANQFAYFGPYIAWEVEVVDINDDDEPDFLNPTIAFQENATSSTGETLSNFYLGLPTSVQVTLSDGSGGHVNPLSYTSGRRPSIAIMAQVIGGANSAPDVILGLTGYGFGNWYDNFGWDGSYDRIQVIEMDYKDLAITDAEINPVDRYIGQVGEGTRDVNVTVTNTGMESLSGQLTVDLELKKVDEVNSTNQTVYSMDWDSPEDKSGCGTGCSWRYEEYIGRTSRWHEQTNHSNNGGDDGNSNISAHELNPTDFMWAGRTMTNSSGGTWTGYQRNWDDAMVLEDVDLTGADRAWLSVELFRHLGFDGLGYFDGAGFRLTEVQDHLAIVEVYSEDAGWTTIACPNDAFFSGDCWSGSSMWGGYDNDRVTKIYQLGGNAEGLYHYGTYNSGTFYGWSNFTEDDLGAFDLSAFAGEEIDIRFRFKSGFTGSVGDDNETRWSGRDGFAVDNISIWKQNTQFFPNPQNHTANQNLNNLAPGEEYVTSIQANFKNGTTYRISAQLSYNGDEQPANDEVFGYTTVENVYDPAIEGISSFNPGGLYPEGLFPIEVDVNHYGNTEVDFDLLATVFSATPSDVLCGTNVATCEEEFSGGSEGYRFSEDGNSNGDIHDDSTCQEVLFGSAAYWFGHPCDKAQSYGDVWENETITLPDVDLTTISGDFISLNFEYFAETFYYIDSDGEITDVNDYTAITFDYEKNSQQFSAVLFGQWNDYNGDGTCQNDDNNDGIIWANESIDNGEISWIGDPSNIDGSGAYNVLFNTDGLVKSKSIDLTHLYVLNTTDASSLLWERECISLAGSTVQINFEFQSDDDGHNGQNDDLRGIGFDNISLKELTFVKDTEYTATVSGLDSEEKRTVKIADHDFYSGVYMVQVESIFDNSTVGTAWYGMEEVSDSNNQERVIFNVESVDITLGKPNTLGCLTESYSCLLPIDSALEHEWEVAAINGVLTGDYTFHMTVEDITDSANPSVVHSASNGDAQTLNAHERSEISFTPWNGWTDGSTYNISFHAELSNGEMSGNVRYFHATFAEMIDIAILSDDTVRTDAVLQDLEILGLTYTQFEINDWEAYLDSGWMTHYDKILLPMQDEITAKDVENGGRGYYQLLGSTSNRQVLENHMSAGGTVQAHLGPYKNYYESLNGRLPFGMDVQNKDTTESAITFSDLDVADQFHPLLDDVDTNAFQGFDAQSTVANAILNTKSVSSTNVPNVCGGYSEDGGSFQRILQSDSEPQDTLLGVCSYFEGGLIITTIDVESHSERADSTTFPLLGNMLQYHVTKYPDGFGTLNNGLDLTINGEVPELDPQTGGYKVRYMKSNAELNFAFTTSTTATLDADWLVTGPTAWDGSTLTSGSDHNPEESPSMTFCKVDFSSATNCLQDASWEVEMYVHDAEGHSRVLTITVMTNDILADDSRPVAEAIVDVRDDYEELIALTDTRTVQGVEWEVWELQLDEDGKVTVHFDASNSSDADALTGSGIESYKWTVLFDAPYDDDSFDLEGHTFTQSASTEGKWAYTFANATIDPATDTKKQIRIELQVYDGAGKVSEKFRIYMVVAPEGYGDEEPVIKLTDSLNGSTAKDDWFYVTGTVLSGSEEGDVYVEIALANDDFTASAVEKYNLRIAGKWNVSEGLGNGGTFNLGVDISGLYSNVSRTQEIHIRTYEGDDERWEVTSYIEINLQACQGKLLPAEAVNAGGRWIMGDEGCEPHVPEGSGEVIVDDNGTIIGWTPPDETKADKSESGDQMLTYGLIGGGVLIILLVSVLFVMKGGSDDDKAFGDQAYDDAYDAVQEMDPMEAYVQQLIAQGYPEDTARAYAQQYAAHFQQQ